MSDMSPPAGESGGETTTSSQSLLADLPSRIRIHALAKLLGRSSRDVLECLAGIGEQVRGAQSSVTAEVARRVGAALLDPDTAAESLEPVAGPGRSVPPLPVFASASPVFMPPEPVVVRPAREALEESDSDSEREVDEPDESDQSADAGDEESGRPRRRRGRRGRGRGKGGSADDGSDDESTDDEPKDKPDKPGKADKTDKTGKPGKRGTNGSAKDDSGKQGSDADSDGRSDEKADGRSDADGDSDQSGDGEGNRRRRRRRRRKGGDDESGPGADEDDPPNTVVHVRAAREEKADPGSSRDEVRSVRGSTRLEAKRQRRRDGREAGRRRAPILSEAEFLARREAVDRAMVVRERGDRTQIGVLEDGVLVEHFVTSSGSGSLVGNVYLGRVQNVLPSMEAAFVDIGRGRNAVLYAGEVDWDAAGLEGKARKIEQALSTGDSVLVQVTKDPVGHKGARLTTQISLPGRFLVYVPGGGATGISRKLPENERRRLKDVLKRIVPEDAGVIIRTASEGISEEELGRDVRRLQAQWQVIKDKTGGANGSKKASAPALLYEEPDLLVKVVRDLFTEDFSALVVEGDIAWDTIEAYVRHVAPELTERLRRHVGHTDVFDEYRVDEQLLKALDRKVWLPSGGYLVIDRTEAMTVIDVNTGKFTGSGGNLEETVTRNNLESAEEIVRQLRLRDIGGIIVIDFIDMVLESNRDLVLRRLTECLGRDRTRHQVAEVTSLGLVQMTRKRVGTGLLEAFSATCEHCKGRGLLMSTEPMAKAGGSNGSSGGGSGQQQQGGSRRSRGRGGSEPQDKDKSAGQSGVAAQAAKEAVRGIAMASGKSADKPADEPGQDQPDQGGSATGDSARTDSARTDSARTDSARTDSAGTERPRTGKVRTERARTDTAPTGSTVGALTATETAPAHTPPAGTAAADADRGTGRPAAEDTGPDAQRSDPDDRHTEVTVPTQASSPGPDQAGSVELPVAEGTGQVTAPSGARRRGSRRAASRPAGPPVHATHDG